MGLFKSISHLAIFLFILGLFFVIFGKAIPVIGDQVTTIAPATLGEKSTSTLVDNVYKALFLWMPLVAIGFTLYYVISEIFNREQGAGRL